MPRLRRIEYADALYHVMSRSNRRQDNFPSDINRQDFLKTFAEAKADRIVAEVLRALGWTEAEMGRRHKSDPAKLALSAPLRRETTLTTKAITARRHLGSWKSTATRLQQRKRNEQTTDQMAMF